MATRIMPNLKSNLEFVTLKADSKSHIRPIKYSVTYLRLLQGRGEYVYMSSIDSPHDFWTRSRNDGFFSRKACAFSLRTCRSCREFVDGTDDCVYALQVQKTPDP